MNEELLEGTEDFWIIELKRALYIIMNYYIFFFAIWENKMIICSHNFIDFVAKSLLFRPFLN